mgnify:FL=1|tara:strand:+ start:476 stop:1237 length:762 start_codon:yes stop_codon:yes gene_type:complete
MNTQYLRRDNAPELAHEFLPQEAATHNVMFLGGFRSDMTGSKAEALAGYARQGRYHFLRFDYRGHGASGGQFEDACVSDWLQDAKDIATLLPDLPTILIGSSMGGYIAMLLARAKAHDYRGLIGIAAAPDFTERLMWSVFTAAQKRTLHEVGFIEIPTEYDPEPYRITWKLIEDGRKHLLLDRRIKLGMPCHFLQGERDEDVPPNWPSRIAATLEDEDVLVTMIKDGDHRLSRPQDISLLIGCLDHIRVKTGL